MPKVLAPGRHCPPGTGARFGDAGPGFVPASCDPRWNQRSDISARKSGDWTLKTILFGGASGHYDAREVVALTKEVDLDEDAA